MHTRSCGNIWDWRMPGPGFRCARIPPECESVSQQRLTLFRAGANGSGFQNLPVLPLRLLFQIAERELPFVPEIPILRGVKGLPEIPIRRGLAGARKRIMAAEFREQSHIQWHAEENSAAISNLLAGLGL